MSQTFYFPELEALRKLYPHGHHMYDKEYRPIYIERVGKINLDEVAKVTSPERMLDYYAMGYEILQDKIFKACTDVKRK